MKTLQALLPGILLLMVPFLKAENLGKVDNLYQYVLRGQTEKFDKTRADLNEKSLTTFKAEVDYVDQLKVVMLGQPTDACEAYYTTYMAILAEPSKTRLVAICNDNKITFDSLKTLADNKIIARLQLSNDLVREGRAILASIDKTKYPVTSAYRTNLVSMIYNAQYSDLLTSPTLDKYRAFIADWPESDKLPMLKQKYDDALFEQSVKDGNHDLYLFDTCLPNETKRHLVPDDWSIYGDRQAEKGEFGQAVVFYNKAIQLGSKEGLFKLTVLKYEGKIKSDEDELPVFQKLADAGDSRAKEYVFTIQNRTLTLAVEGTLDNFLTNKDKARLVNMTLGGSISEVDLKVLKDMALKGKLVRIDLSSATIEQIPAKAFAGCDKLLDLKLPNSVKIIGNEAFLNCTGLANLLLPEYLEELSVSALNGCTGLTSLQLPVTLSRGLGFGTLATGCKKLTQILVAEGNSAYSSIDGVLFSKDGSLLVRYPAGKIETSYTVPATVAEIGFGAFEDAVRLSTVQLPDGLKTIRDGAFRGCNALRTIQIPPLVTSIGAMVFENCTGLNSFNNPNQLTEIGYRMFKNCSSLALVSIPESVTEIRAEAFSGCSALASITLLQSIKGLGDKCFENCRGLREIHVKHPNPLILTTAFQGVDASLCTLFVPVNSKPAYQQYPVWKDFVTIMEE